MTAIEELAILFGSERPTDTESARDRDRTLAQRWWVVKDLRSIAERARDAETRARNLEDAELIARRTLEWWRSTR